MVDADYGLELGCRFKDIPSGEYRIRIHYYLNDVDASSHISWVVFNELPRRVYNITSNGYVPFSSSTMGEPVVAIYNPTVGDKIYFFAIWVFLRLPFLVGPLFLLYIVYIYNKYGKDVTDETVPEVYHTNPSDRPPLEVALFFSGSPNNIDVAKAISAVIAHGVVEGVVELNDVLRVKGDLSNLPKEEREILEVLNGVRVDDVDRNLALKLRALVRKIHNKLMPKVYDNSGDKRVGVVLIIATLLVIASFFGIPFIILDKLFPILDPLIGYFVWIATMLSLLIMGVAIFKFSRYALGKYKDGLYKEALLWEAFKRLLSDESRIREYGLDDKHMWGKWLAYAYALGVSEKIIKLLAQKANVYNASLISRYGVALARVSPSGVSSYNRGLGGGFRGGGRFGMR